LKPEAANRTYNLDGVEKVTIKQIAGMIQKLVGNVPIEYVDGRPGDFSGKEISSERARRELNWEPKVSFEEGLRRYVTWYKQREEEMRKDEQKLDQVLRSKA